MKRKIIIIMVVLVILLVGTFIGNNYYVNEILGKSNYLSIELNGDKNVTIEVNSEYNDEGAKAEYKNKDITKDIKIEGEVDITKLGTYNIMYTIKYLKQEKKVDRKVEVVDTEKPTITLKGKEEVVVYTGNNYEDEGVTVTDNYDTNLDDKVVVTNDIDNKKVGEYTVTYTVSDSSNNTNSVTRKVKVMEKPIVSSHTGGQVAVLNYHFFYKNEGECNETICFRIDKFEEQIKYLKENNIRILTMDEFVDYMYGKLELNGKAVLLTVDDGAYGTGKHNGNYLIPILEKYKVEATLFLITGWWDIGNYSSPYLNVESHTHKLHIEQNCGYRSKVNCVSYDDLVKDLNKSIAVTKSKQAFCFPFYESTNTSVKAVQDVGFKVAFVGGGRKASKNGNKYQIPRYVIYKNTSLEQFKYMVN